MARKTEEGIQRGMMMIAPMSPGGRRYLWCVSRVLSKHKVQIISHSGDMLMEAEMWTHNIHAEDSDAKLINYLDSEKYENTGLIEFYELEKKDVASG